MALAVEDKTHTVAVEFATETSTRRLPFTFGTPPLARCGGSAGRRERRAVRRCSAKGFGSSLLALAALAPGRMSRGQGNWGK